MVPANNNMRRIFISVLLFAGFFAAEGQKLREIVVEKDTIREYNKSIGVVEEAFVQNGIKLYVVDSLQKVIEIARFKNNKLNGDYFAFYLDVNMLEHKGSYKNDKKNGTWYYWNRKGELIRTEEWTNGKLDSKKILTSSH